MLPAGECPTALGNFDAWGAPQKLALPLGPALLQRHVVWQRSCGGPGGCIRLAAIVLPTVRGIHPAWFPQVSRTSQAGSLSQAGYLSQAGSHSQAD